MKDRVTKYSRRLSKKKCYCCVFLILFHFNLNKYVLICEEVGIQKNDIFV